MYLSFGLFFFWRISGTVVAVGVPDFFFACGWIETVVLKKQHCELARIAKSVTKKKQQQGGLCGSQQKDRASPEVRGAGIFDGWGFCPGGAARNKLSGET
jgi:hypothetical protein